MRRQKNRMRPEKMKRLPKAMDVIMREISKKLKYQSMSATDEVKVERLPGGKVRVTYTFAEIKQKIKDENWC